MKKEPILYGDGIHDDTAAVQAMLDKGGRVFLPDGRYLISAPLIIHSNTHFLLSSQATLRLADGANCSLLDNDGLYSDETNENIIVEGGIWDGNHDAQVRQKIPNETKTGDENEDKPCVKQIYVSNIYTVLMVRFIHTKGLTVKDLTFKDPTTFALHIADCRYFNIENITLDYDLTKPNMDGIHVQGPARFGTIRNIRGNAHDDHVALCANGTVRSEITRGDIEDVDVDGIYCDNGYTGVRLLSRGDAIRNVHIRNIHGEFRYYAVSFTHHYPLRDDRPILLENIHVSDAFVSKSRAAETPLDKHFAEHGALFWFEGGVNCKNVLIENVYRNERNIDTVAPTIRISEGATVDNLQIKNVNEQFAGKEVPTIENDGNCTPILS